MDTDLIEKAVRRSWFYEFDLPDGRKTTAKVDKDIIALHECRRDMLRDILFRRYGDRLGEKDALDLACHEGFFSLELAAHCRSVRGVDRDAHSIGGAKLISKLKGMGIGYKISDINDLNASNTRRADVVLLFGLLYHVEDVLRTLRIATDLCRDTLIIETQLAPFDVEGGVEWGDFRGYRRIRGTFFLVDDQDNHEGGSTDLALVPSAGALIYSLGKMGFDAHLAKPPKGAHEQLARGHRGIIVASRRRSRPPLPAKAAK